MDDAVGGVAGAEDALSEAFLATLHQWPQEGVPAKPKAWLLAMARRRLIDAQRRGAVPAVVDAIHTAAKRMNRRPPKFTNAAARQLAAHGWPGHVRELQNAVELAIILAQGGPLQFDAPATSRPAPIVQIPDGSPVLTRADLKQRERESIAAALLGMRPTTLASRIKALGLVRETKRWLPDPSASKAGVGSSAAIPAERGRSPRLASLARWRCGPRLEYRRVP